MDSKIVCGRGADYVPRRSPNLSRHRTLREREVECAGLVLTLAWDLDFFLAR